MSVKNNWEYEKFCFSSSVSFKWNFRRYANADKLR